MRNHEVNFLAHLEGEAFGDVLDRKREKEHFPCNSKTSKDLWVSSWKEWLSWWTFFVISGPCDGGVVQQHERGVLDR